MSEDQNMCVLVGRDGTGKPIRKADEARGYAADALVWHVGRLRDVAHYHRETVSAALVGISAGDDATLDKVVRFAAGLSATSGAEVLLQIKLRPPEGPDMAWRPQDVWERHPVHTVEDWRAAVRDDDTRTGYIDWVNHKLTEDADHN